jgi:hypothetical protein
MTTETEQDFIRAIRANNYAHIELTENMALISDQTDEGDFRPFVSVEDDSLNERDVEEELVEFDWLEWGNVEIVEEQGINFDFCEIYDAEFVDPAQTPYEDDE